MKIAIVGAGPAGCHLAHLLADSEHEILLFDHRVRPPHEAGYEKPCGGGLSPLVGQRFPDVMSLPFPRHRPPRVLLRASDGSQVEQALDSSDWAIVSRAEFGCALLERALRSPRPVPSRAVPRRPDGPASGMVRHRGWSGIGDGPTSGTAAVPVANGRVRHICQRVTGLERAGEGWTVHTAAVETFLADFLVGADGVRSIVRRQVVGPIPRQHLAMAVGYRVRGVPDAIVFQTFDDLDGYLWSFPRADHASVGIASRLGAVRPWDLWRRVDRFLDEVCPGADKLDRYVALLPMTQDPSLWDTPCVGPGWALLGDAAGHVHPITGEGIAYALWSAELLAEAFARGGPQAYDSLWHEAYGHGLMAASAMLSGAGSDKGAYEFVFQLAMAMALQSAVQTR